MDEVFKVKGDTAASFSCWYFPVKAISAGKEVFTCCASKYQVLLYKSSIHAFCKNEENTSSLNHFQKLIDFQSQLIQRYSYQPFIVWIYYLQKFDFCGSIGQTEKNILSSLPASRLDKKISKLIVGVFKTVSFFLPSFDL